MRRLGGGRPWDIHGFADQAENAVRGRADTGTVAMARNWKLAGGSASAQ